MIENSRIYLRAPEPVDVIVMFRWENDRSIWCDGRTRAPISMHRLMQYVENYSPDIAAEGQARFIICDRQTDTPLGSIDLYEYDSVNRRCGVGIVIDEHSRRQGIASEAIKLLTEYLKTDLGFHQIWAVVAKDNNPSMQLFLSTGFKVSGRLRSWIRIGKSYEDAFVMQRLL